MNTLEKIDFKNKKAVIRVDFNVPVDNKFKVSDNKKKKETMPTKQYILSNGGSCILISQ